MLEHSDLNKSAGYVYDLWRSDVFDAALNEFIAKIS